MTERVDGQAGGRGYSAPRPPLGRGAKDGAEGPWGAGLPGLWAQGAAAPGGMDRGPRPQADGGARPEGPPKKGPQAEDRPPQGEEGDSRDQLEKEYMLETGSVLRTRGRHAIHCLTVVGQIEGHAAAAPGQKATKYEHVIPQLVAVQEDPEIEGLLIILNTVGGDVEAGLALAELIAGVSKPTASLVLGGGHSIGIPLAVCARRSFIVPTATMTVHPVRHSGMMLGVPQTMSYFERMQQRITGFVTAHSHIPAKRFTQLMMKTGEMVLDVGSVLDGGMAVKEGLIDQLGSLQDALQWLYSEIERQAAEDAGQAGAAPRPKRQQAARQPAAPKPAARRTPAAGAGGGGPLRRAAKGRQQ